MENEKIITVLERSGEKTTVSARVNSYIVEQYKEYEIPVSLVIETSLIHFLKLSDEERIKFISNNIVEKTLITDIKTPKRKWNELISDYMNKLALPTTVMKGLLTGLAVGAIAVIGSMLSGIDIDEDKR